MRRSRPFFVAAAFVAFAACGGESEDFVGEPAGMGAGRPDTAAVTGEDPARDVLRGPGYGPTDTALVEERGADIVPDTAR